MVRITLKFAGRRHDGSCSHCGYNGEIVSCYWQKCADRVIIKKACSNCKRIFMGKQNTLDKMISVGYGDIWHV